MDDYDDTPSHDAGTRKGEELAAEGEEGRVDTGSTGAGRSTGTSDARMATGINPEAEEPIDPESPNLTPS